jgi:adenylosuccinate lyase
VALPDASIVLHYMLVKFESLIDNLVVEADRMLGNLASTRGLVFSQAVLLALVEKGLTRDVAYRIVQGHALEAWNGKGSLRDLLAADSAVDLSQGDLDRCFALEKVGETSGIVFERLGSLQVG